MTLWKETTNVLPANGATVWIRRFPGIEHPKQAYFSFDIGVPPTFELVVNAPDSGHATTLVLPAQYVHSWRPLAGGTPSLGACMPLEGTGSPIGVAQPGFIGQLYIDDDGPHYWRSTGISPADWLQIDTGAPSVLHAIVQNWALRVVANGGDPVSDPTKAALSAFLFTLDDALLTTQMLGVCCFVPDSLIASITPLIVGTGLDPWTNYGPFIPADLTANGLKADGISKHLHTGLRAAGIFHDVGDCGISLYVSSDWTGTSNDIGAQHTTITGGWSRLITDYSGHDYYTAWNGYSATFDLALPSGFHGFHSANARSGVSNQIILANSTYGPTAFDFGGPVNYPPDIEYYVFGSNIDNTLDTVPSAKRYSFCAFHHGLSLDQVTTLFGAVQVMRTALGGGYV